MHVLLIILVGLGLATDVSSLPYRSVEDFAFVPAYFWRDFNGLIPSDAITAGKDANGAATYIAQITTVAEYNTIKAKIHTVPGVVETGSIYAYAPYYGRVIRSNDTTNTKILCYQSSYKFKWYSPTSSFPPNCRYVIAGNEDGIPLFVGRANYNKQVIIGKLFSETTNHRPELIAVYNFTEILQTVYEVLTHCP